MADRYWVGGTGTWNTSSTTNWSATSGGAGGASVPTTSDNVIFDQTSTYTVTMTGALGCRDITVSSGTVTFQNGTSPTLTVGGSWSTIAGTVWNTTGAVSFTSATNSTITSGGITINSPFTFFSSGSGSWTLQDNLTFNSTLTTTLTQGTLALQSFTLTTGAFSSNTARSRTIDFGTGKIALKGSTTATIWDTGTVSGLTVSGTSLVESSGGGTAVTKTINPGQTSEANAISFSLLETTGTVTYTFFTGNSTYIKNLTINGSQTLSNAGVIRIYGSFTHQTTNGTTTFTAGTNAWTFGATSGSYTITPVVGFTYDFPWTFGLTTSTATWTLAANLTLGATRQLTLVNGTTDFNSKTLSAAGITISTGTPTIANTGTANFSTSLPITHTSGTLVLTLDIATTSASGYTLTAGTLTLTTFSLSTPVFSSNNSNTRVIDFSSGRIILNGSATATIWNTATVTGLTIAGTPLVESSGGGTAVTKTINTGALSEANSISFSLLNTGGTVTYAFTAGNVVRNLITNGLQTISNIAILIYGNFTHQTTNGTTTFTAGANAWTFAATSGSYTLGYISGFTYDFPWTFGSATSTATWTLPSNLTLGATRQLTLTNGTTDFNSKTLSAAGITILTGTPTIANTGTASFTTTLPITHTSGSLTLPFNITTSSATGYTFTAGTLALGTFTLTTQIFSSSGTGVRTLNFGTGNITLNPSTAVTMWNTATVTNMTVSGTPLVITQSSGAVTKTISAGALSEANSISFQLNDTAGTIAFTASNTVRNLTVNGTFTLSNIAITIYGNYTYTAATALTAGTNAWTFGATSGTKTISTGATTHDFPFTINGTGGTFQLATNLTLGATRILTLTNGTFDQNAKTITASGITVLTGSVTVNNLNVSQAITHTSGTLTLGTAATTGIYTLTAGTLSLSTFTLTAPSFSSSGSTARTLAFGTGQLTLTNNNATLFDLTTATAFTTTGTVYINSTYTGAVGTRTFVTGFSEAQAAGYDVKTSGSSGIIIGATATDTVALTGSYNNFDLTGLSCTISNTARTIYGSFTVPGVSGTLTAGAATTTFAGAGSETITTNGRTLDFPITFNATGTFSLSDALTIGSTRTVTLTAGTLSLQSFTLSCAIFSSSGATARTLAFGTGQLTLVGNAATIFDVTTATNYSTTGTVKIVSTYTGATGTRTFVTGFTEAQAAGYNVNTSGSTGITFGTTATDGVSFTGSFNDFDLTGLTNTLGNTARTIYGNFAASSSGGTITAGTAVTTLGTTSSKTIHTNGRSLDFPITVTLGSGTVTLLSNLTIGSTRTLTFNSGTFDFGNFVASVGLFSSSNSNARTLAFGTIGQLTLTGSGVTVWDTTTATNFVFTGTHNIFSSYTGATGTRTFSFGSVAEAYIFNIKFAASAQSNALTIAISTDIVSITGNIKDFDLTNFTNTLAAGARNVYGNFTVPAAGGSLTATATATTFAGSSGTSTITTNGRSIPIALTFTGVGKTFQQVGATTLTQALTLTAGTLDLNNATFTALSLSCTGTNVRSIAFGTTGQITVTNNGVTVLDFTDGTNFTWTGTHRIFASYTGATGTRTYTFGTIAEAYTFNVKFNTTAQADAVTIATSTDIASITGNIKDFDLTNFTNTLAAVARNIYGNFTVPAAGGTLTASATATNFLGSSGTSTFTTNGRSIPIAFTFNGAGKTFQQVGATTLTQALTLTAGTLDLNNATFTSTVFSSTNTNARSILFGSTGQLSLTSSGVTLVDIATATNFTWTGNSKIVSTYASSVGTRTFTIGNTAAIDSAYAFDVIVGTGAGINLSASATDSVALTGIYNNVDLRGLASTLTNTARSIAGSFRTSSTGGTYTAGTAVTTFIANTSTYTIDTATRVLDFPFTFQGSATWNIANNFTSGSSTTVSTRTLTLTSGNVSFGSAQINCGLFSSTNTNSRNLDFGASGRILLLNSTTSTLWDTTIGTNFTWTGNFDVDCNFTGAITKTISFGTIAEAYAPNVKVATAGTGFGLNTTSATETVALTGNMGNLDLTSFAGTLTNTARNVYGNLTFPAAGGTFTAGATATTLSATSGTDLITYNERTIDFPITINGTGGTFVANGNVLLGVTRTLTLTNGTFNANSANITASTITVLTGNVAVSNLSTTLTITHTSGDLNLNSNTSTGDYTLTAGNLNLNNYIVTTRTFSSSGSGVRAINFGNTGKVQLASNATVTYWNSATPTNFTYTGNSNIETIGAGGNVTKTINTGAMTEAQALNWNLRDSLGTTFTFTSGNAVRNLILDGQFTILNQPMTIYGDYNFNSTYSGDGYQSAYFNGNDYLAIADGTLNKMESLDFTAEGWIYVQNYTLGNILWAKGGTTSDWLLGTAPTSGRLYFAIGATDYFLTTGPVVPLNTWNHIALVRSGTTFTTYLNGVTANTQSAISIDFSSVGELRIGRGRDSSTNYMSGYVSNARLIKGTALYTTDFTPSTTPLTAIANTVYLTCRSNYFVDLSNNNSTLTGSGNFIITYLNPFNSSKGIGIDTNPSTWTFASSNTQTITTNSYIHDFPITFAGTGTASLQDDLTIGNAKTVTLTSGTLNLNDKLLRTGLFASSGSTARTIGFANTGKIQLISNSASTIWNSATVTNFSYTGNSNIETVGIGSTTRTINTGTMTESQAMNWTLKDTANSTITPTSGNAFRNLSIDGPFALTNVPITIYGDYVYDAPVSTDGYQSMYFDGNGDFLSLPASSPANYQFAFGTGDFTVEAWVYLPLAVERKIITARLDNGGAAGTWALTLSPTTISFTEVIVGEPGPAASFSSIQNQWAHVAASRTSGTTKLFVNGTQVASATQTTNFNNISYPLRIFNDSNLLYQTGFVSNLRIVKGTGLYTGNFTPSTTPLTAVANTVLLTCRSNTPAIDLSNNSLAITTNGNAALSYFNPFNSANGAALAAGTSAWTFASSNTQTITSNSYFHDFPLTFAGTGTVRLQDNLTVGNTRTTTLTSGTLNLNDLNLRTGLFSSSGSTARTIGFANTGKIQLSPTTAVTMWNSATPTNFTYTGNSNIETIGSGITGSTTKTINTGTMSESQAMNWSLKDRSGTVAFTASNAVKKLDLNGPFILSNNPISIYGDYNYYANNINGNQSVYFDGTGDYLSVAANTALSLGTGDFTVECWVYYNDVSYNKGFISRYTATTGWSLRYDGGLNFMSGDTLLAGYVMVPVKERWYHYAATRSGTTLKLFIDGVEVTSVTNSTNLDSSATLTIGSLSTTLWYFNGYISNVRVLKGTALYTGNFTPSTTPLTAVANTVLLACRSEQAIDISNNNFAITVNGNSTVNYFNPFDSANAAPILSAGTNTWTFANTVSQNINTGNITHDFPWTFNGVGGIFNILSNTTIGSTRTTTLTNGTLDLNGYNYTTGLFATADGTKTLQFDGGRLTISGSGATAFNNASNTGFNIIAGSNTGTISLTSSTAKTFVGNNFVYPAILDQGGTGDLTVTGNNTFQDISATISSSANSNIFFTANTTTTVNNFTLTGTATYRPVLNSTVEYERAYLFRTTGANTIHSGANYIQCRNIGFTPYYTDGSDYLRWWIGDGSLSLNNNKGAVFQTYDANTSPKVYVVEANTSWTVPDDFNVSNNTIHMFGAGGAGGAGIFTGGDGFAGGGGGGGGYSKVTNLYAVKNQKLTLEIGIGGDSSLSANGGNTKLISWYGVYNAGGGTNGRPGSGTAAGSRYLGGIGGSGLTFNGGNGGNGHTNSGGSYKFSAGGGGAGAGGPLGVGGNGANGLGYNGSIFGSLQGNAGGGGGGTGGGTNGSVGSISPNNQVGTGGNGGNNALGFGQGIGTTTDPSLSFSGGGGGGAGYATTTGSGDGSSGIDVLNSFGGGSGSGGGASRGALANANRATGIPGIYGGGGGGGGASILNTATTYLGAGSSGSNGGIIIVYKPSKAPSSNGSFFTLF